MYPDVDIQYYFDHSSCHDKMLEDGLNVNNMNEKYGGKKPKMRDTVIPSVGEHTPKFVAGDTQRLVFQEGDAGPDHLSEEERELNKHTCEDTGAGKPTPKTRSMMLKAIREAGIELPKRRFSAKELREFGEQHGLASNYQKKNHKVGWLNQPKGIRQVLWERGLLDPNKTYTMDGPKGADGKRDLGRSLKHILSQCPDFKNELSALQHLAKRLGTEVICSPKYHAEIAGEGIEYCWALAKNWFKRIPLSERKTREQFEAKVDEALSTSVLTITRVRGCARRQRTYILAYAHLHKGEEAGEGAAAAKQFVDIEKMAQLQKAHRSAADQDTAYIRKLEMME